MLDKILKWLSIKKYKCRTSESLYNKIEYLINIDIDLIKIKNEKLLVIYEDLYRYYEVSKILSEFDYNNRLTHKRLYTIDAKEIIVKEWILHNDELILDYNVMFKKVLHNTLKIILIYDVVKDAENNNFNSIYLKQYIINMQNIVDRVLLYVNMLK